MRYQKFFLKDQTLLKSSSKNSAIQVYSAQLKDFFRDSIDQNQTEQSLQSDL